MNLKDFKNALQKIKTIEFKILNNKSVPKHFHITEVGTVTKKFIDCGGTVRETTVINFQLWTALDFDHRLDPQKLANIIKISEEKLNINETLEIQAEYQQTTISLFDVDFDGKKFILKPQNTNCLATDKCGISPTEIPTESCCSGGGCC